MEKDKEELIEEYKTRNRYLIYLKESEDEHKDELIKEIESKLNDIEKELEELAKKEIKEELLYKLQTYGFKLKYIEEDVYDETREIIEELQRKYDFLDIQQYIDVKFCTAKQYREKKEHYGKD